MKLKRLVLMTALMAMTIPLTVQSAMANFNDDYESYAQNLKARMQSGRNSGQLSQAQFDDAWQNIGQIDSVKAQYGGRDPNDTDRNNIMNSLTGLDQKLTGFLHDNQFSRYQYWDRGHNTWKHNAPMNMPSFMPQHNANNNYDPELAAYQQNLQTRLEQGKASGKLTPEEYGRLNNRLQQIRKTEADYRPGGINTWERNNMMNMMTQLDKDTVSELRDRDQSHYQNWNSNNNNMGWKQNWWQNKDNNNNNNNNQGGSGRRGRWNNN